MFTSVTLSCILPSWSSDWSSLNRCLMGFETRHRLPFFLLEIQVNWVLPIWYCRTPSGLFRLRGWTSWDTFGPVYREAFEAFWQLSLRSLDTWGLWRTSLIDWESPCIAVNISSNRRWCCCSKESPFTTFNI